MKAGFGIGLLLPFIFQMILGFGSAQYRDGTRASTQPAWWRMWSTRPRTPSPAATTAARSSERPAMNKAKEPAARPHGLPALLLHIRNREGLLSRFPFLQ